MYLSILFVVSALFYLLRARNKIVFLPELKKPYISFSSKKISGPS